jgi:oxygen-dependent protoporphyrinogen oxidase
VQTIERRYAGWMVPGNHGSDSFDAVIVATPAPAASRLLRAVSPGLPSELGGISYSSSVTVTLGYGQDVRSLLPPGFGFLVPHREGKRILATTFVHNKFPCRAPQDRALIRCFLGGSRDEQVLAFSNEEILRIVRQELKQMIGVTSEPRFTRIYKWQRAMAQYSIGHLERLERIERLRQQLPGLALAGNGYTGIGIPDCIRSGTEAASQVLNALGLTQAKAQFTTS